MGRERFSWYMEADHDAVEKMLERIHHELSPEYLTDRYVLPYEAARESFRPSFMRGDIIQVGDELERFVEHVSIRIYLRPEAWEGATWLPFETMSVARDLFWKLGDWRDVGVEIEQRGMRGLLDRAIGIMRQESIDAHVEIGLHLSVRVMSPASRFMLAERYLEEFGSRLPGVELTHVALLENAFLDVLRDHARLSLSRAQEVLWGPKRSRD